MYRICVLKRSWGGLWPPWGSLRTPWGRSEDLVNFCVNTCSNFYRNSAVEIKILNMLTNMRVQLLGKFGRGNQIYMNFDDQFPTQKCQNHCFYNCKWCSWNSNPAYPEFPEFPERESSRAAPTLGSTRAGGHDDGSEHKLPQMNVSMRHPNM